MTILQRIALGVLAVGLIATGAMAGPNEGGVLVVHATSLAYTSDATSYLGQSGVACGQDGPEPPDIPVCPPYDPVGGAIPCVPTAANPTASVADSESFIWYVMAAFSDQSCPKLKAVGFGFDYDEDALGIAAWGYTDGTVSAFAVEQESRYDSRPFPAPGASTGLSFQSVRTSRLQELYWFAGYAYSAGAVKRFSIIGHTNPLNHFFIDDAVPGVEDPITGYGYMGFLGETGSNPEPTAPSPIDETTWGQIKATYSK